MNAWISYKGDKLAAPEDVKGYETLSDKQKNLFNGFLKNYYKAWEYPEDHLPVKVKFIDKENYLKVEFCNKEWLHVTNTNIWY